MLYLIQNNITEYQKCMKIKDCSVNWTTIFVGYNILHSSCILGCKMSMIKILFPAQEAQDIHHDFYNRIADTGLMYLPGFPQTFQHHPGSYSKRDILATALHTNIQTQPLVDIQNIHGAKSCAKTWQLLSWSRNSLMGSKWASPYYQKFTTGSYT